MNIFLKIIQNACSCHHFKLKMLFYTFKQKNTHFNKYVTKEININLENN